MKQFYFITIDKASGKVLPNEEEYFVVLDKVYKKYRMMNIPPYKVQAFEFKSKGKLTKWIHLHVLAYSNTLFSEPKLKIKIKGYSIKIKLLVEPMDIACTAGYIQKNMKDETQCHFSDDRSDSAKGCDVFDEYAFQDSPSPPTVNNCCAITTQQKIKK